MKEVSTLIEEYSEETVQVAIWSLQIITYRLDIKYVCIINNLDPGATICRETSDTRKGVQRLALQRANEYLSKTVSLDVYAPTPEEVQLAKIMQMDEDPPKTFSVKEFLEVPIQERMNFILGGTLAFYGDQNQLIPAGTAMKLLSEASA